MERGSDLGEISYQCHLHQALQTPGVLSTTCSMAAADSVGCSFWGTLEVASGLSDSQGGPMPSSNCGGNRSPEVVTDFNQLPTLPGSWGQNQDWR